MPKGSLTHEECLSKVCALCTNLIGVKATRLISEKQAEFIKKYIFSGYRKNSKYFPQGLCMKCHNLLDRLKKEKEEEEQKQVPDQDKEPMLDQEARVRSKVQLLLPENYHCGLPHETRSKQGASCTCRWCILARLNGREFLNWKNESIKSRKDKPFTWMCQSCGRGISSVLEAIPEQLKLKLTEAPGVFILHFEDFFYFVLV